jgi:p21-activated kinase 1/protein-serine/threonine kinase
MLDTGIWVAIKKIPRTTERFTAALNEVYILKNSQHPNVPKFYEAFITGEEVWIVMEAMTAGCLTDILECYESTKMTEPQIAYTCREVP